MARGGQDEEETDMQNVGLRGQPWGRERSRREVIQREGEPQERDHLFCLLERRRVGCKEGPSACPLKSVPYRCLCFCA